jgi:hypothetical protein
MARNQPFEDFADEVDVELYEHEEEPRCGTCLTSLASTGPRARDAYCSTECYDLASAAADEAADNRYL